MAPGEMAGGIREVAVKSNPVSAKSHHYNPQVYLRQFTSRKCKNQLWEYDLRQGTVQESTPKLCGCEDYYHSFYRTDDVRDDETIEQSFQTIENKLPKLFEAIRNKRSISDDLWDTFYLFAALQRVRCPKALRSFQKGLGQTYEMIFEMSKRSREFDNIVRAHGLDPEEARRLEFEIKADQGHALGLILSAFNTGHLPSIFSEIEWRFLCAPPNEYFLTSDDPVCFWAPKNERGPFGGVGATHANVEITFPLSRNTCAFGSWGLTQPRLYLPLPVEQVSLINHRTIFNAWHHIYGSSNNPQILNLVERIAKCTNEASTQAEQ